MQDKRIAEASFKLSMLSGDINQYADRFGEISRYLRELHDKYQSYGDRPQSVKVIAVVNDCEIHFNLKCELGRLPDKKEKKAK